MPLPNVSGRALLLAYASLMTPATRERATAPVENHVVAWVNSANLGSTGDALACSDHVLLVNEQMMLTYVKKAPGERSFVDVQQELTSVVTQRKYNRASLQFFHVGADQPLKAVVVYKFKLRNTRAGCAARAQRYGAVVGVTLAGVAQAYAAAQARCSKPLEVCEDFEELTRWTAPSR